MIQMNLFKTNTQTSFGGTLNKGKRKVARPLTTKKPIHLVLKSDRSLILLKNIGLVKGECHRMNKKFGIQLYELAVHADHFHICLKIASRLIYQKWIRALSGSLALKIQGLRWKLKPYTRIATWGREFRKIKEYIHFNREEGEFILTSHKRLMAFLKREIPFSDILTELNKLQRQLMKLQIEKQPK